MLYVIRVGIFGTSLYGSPDIVRHFVAQFNADAILVHSGSNNVNRIAVSEAKARKIPVRLLNWRSKPRAVPGHVDRILIFWDGMTEQLAQLDALGHEHNIPVVVVDNWGNILDLARHPCQTLLREVNMPVLTEPKEGTKVRITLAISEELLAQYEAQANGKKIETVLLKRLTESVNHTAQRGLYFGDAERQELEKVFSKMLNSPGDVLKCLKSAVTAEVGGIKVQIPEKILYRLKSRASMERATVEEYTAREILYALERVTGLRP